MKYVELDEMNNLIDICNSNLLSNKKCLEYLEKRKINQEIIAKHKIGYFPQNIDTLLKYVSEEFLVDKSILNSYKRSEFSDYYYLIFPIYNEYAEPIAIMGRTLLDDIQRKYFSISKYKNSSYSKSTTLYNLDKAKEEILKQQNVYIVEGTFDVLAMSYSGLPNTVGICGSAFSKNHFLKLARYTDTLTFLLDNDEAGFTSMKKIKSKFKNYNLNLNFKVLNSPCKDVDEYFSSGKTKNNFIKELTNLNLG